MHESRNVYVSEQGPQVYDSILALLDDDSGQNIQSKAIINSLLYLGLGRESILYEYEEEFKSFRLRFIGSCMSGYSHDLFESLSGAIILQGNAMKHLRSFINDTRRPGRSSAVLAAVASQISSILLVTEAEILDSSTSIHSLLQLQALFERPWTVLECLSTLVSRVQGIRNETSLLSYVFNRVREAEHGPFYVKQVLYQVLVAASTPWRAEIAHWLGISIQIPWDSHNSIPAFTGVLQGASDLNATKILLEDNYQFDPSSLPVFISVEDAQLIFQTGKSMQLLREHQQGHPLIRSAQSPMKDCPRLEWGSSWPDIERIVDQAKVYELNLRDAITKFENNASNESAESPEIKTTGMSDADFGAFLSRQDVEGNIERSIAEIEGSLFNDDAEGKLAWLARGSDTPLPYGETEAKDFAPPISLLPSLSFQPVIAAQARLANQACLRLLFKYHDLWSHLSILHRYSLFGDGVFASRLSHALFDPDLQSAKRRKGRYPLSILGLKLGYRETWPPASSELRLALMGILNESFFPAQYLERASLFREEMPGGLSFAIRDMSKEEVQKCIDPHSINALDFLRLQYQAPSPINTIISTSSLQKYDTIFRLLLRAKRMQFVVDQLSRDIAHKSQTSHQGLRVCLRFRIESCHFVSVVCAYFYAGVTAEWTQLERMLKITESVLDQGGSNAESVAKLRDFHEQFLDRLVLTLLLRSRQAEVMKLLEEIFGLILRFASYVRAMSQAAQLNPNDLYAAFQAKVKVFINVCRGLSERRGQGGTKSANETYDNGSRRNYDEDGYNTIGRLLLNLEMNGFYAR